MRQRHRLLQFYGYLDGPRNSEDYIQIARWYPTVIISGVPLLDRGMQDAARRYIAMVDVFRGRKARRIVSAATSVDEL